MDNPMVLSLAVLAVIILLWWYRDSRVKDRFAAVLAKPRPDATISSRAQLIDGANHIPVALTLDPRGINYENADLDASIDLGQIDEVEYASDLVTGGIADGAVLRLRAHGRAIEFVLNVTTAEQWSHVLPPHRMGEAGTVHAV